jgi:hypothetical protein
MFLSEHGHNKINCLLVLDKLLQSLLINKSIDINTLLISDKTAIFIAIRRFAYGDAYPVNVGCPACAKPNRVDINLANLTTLSIDFESTPRNTNEFFCELPKSHAKVSYKLLNQSDEDEISKELEALKRVNKEDAHELTTRLKHRIISVNGSTEQVVIRKFVDEMLAADSRALREHIRNHTPDIDMRFDFICEHCSFERRLDIPVGASFLWPDLDA